MNIRYIFLIMFAVLLQSCMVSNKSVKDSDTNETAEIVEVNLPRFIMKAAIRKALKEDNVPKEAARVVRKIKNIKVFTADNASPSMIRRLAHKAFGESRQELVTINTEDTEIRISPAIDTANGIIKNLYLIVKSKDNFTFIKVEGKFPLNDIAQAISSEVGKKGVSAITLN